MRETLLRRASAALVLALAAAGAAAVPAVAKADDPGGLLIAEPEHGRQAVSRLGDGLDDAARVNSMTPADLRRLLLDDRTATVDRRGKLYYRDPVRTGAKQTGAGVAPYPLDQTFRLNSLPGSQHTLFIDFDGAVVENTFWNADNGVAGGFHPAWTVDADASTFNDDERRLIQDIWLRVAEDFAPFDVNVTTQDPGDAAIDRSGAADPTYGTRALVTPDNQAVNAICGGGCVGVAYMDVFSEPRNHSKLQPAWIFPQAYTSGTGASTKGIAETISHEVGHNLALNHDGDATEAYYPGHGSWAPIMGNSDLKPITQWSSGEYAGANNQQDDFAVVAAAGAPLRADEAPGTITADVTAPPTGPAYISSRGDRDVYSLGPCAGSVTVTAAPAPSSPNLDIELALLDDSGQVVATANPSSAMADRDRASGLDASLTRNNLAAGDYYVRVDGAGNGTASSGYTDYASVGSYQLTVSGCNTPAAAPSAPTSVSAAMDNASHATIRWSPPASDGGSAVTGYDVSIDSGVWQPLGAAARSHTFTAESGDSHTLAVRAHNDVGTGASVSRTVSVPVVAATAPDAPRIKKARNGARGGKSTAKARWAAPASDGGSAVLGYQVVALKIRNGFVRKQKESRVVPASFRAHTMRLRRGTWRFVVLAHNDLGWSQPSRTSNKVRAR